MWPAVILKCQNHLVHFILIIIRYYVINLMNFSFKMPWRYVKQVAAPNMALYTSIILKKKRSMWYAIIIFYSLWFKKFIGGPRSMQ
jgi:hypothetical protein